MTRRQLETTGSTLGVETTVEEQVPDHSGFPSGSGILHSHRWIFRGIKLPHFGTFLKWWNLGCRTGEDVRWGKGKASASKSPIVSSVVGQVGHAWVCYSKGHPVRVVKSVPLVSEIVGRGVRCKRSGYSRIFVIWVVFVGCRFRGSWCCTPGGIVSLRLDTHT